MFQRILKPARSQAPARKPSTPKKSSTKPSISPEDSEAISLLAAAGYDWVQAKKMYIGQPGEPMRKLVEYRKRYVDGRLQQILKDPKFTGVSLSSPGSVNITSDYDITLVGGTNTWQAVREFNEKFRKEWGRESGTVFDTNVYAADFPPPGSKGSWIPAGARPPGWDDAQEKASLSKVRRFMDQGEWNSYAGRVADATQDQQPASTRGQQVRQIFAEADRMYSTYVAHLADRLETQAVGRMRPREKPADFVDRITHSDENAVIEGRNTLYAIGLRGMQTEIGRGTRRQPVNVAELASQSLLFAMEAYHSAGSVFDVVHSQQAGKTMEMTPSDYLQSFNEQLGDAFKDLAHYSADPGKAFYQSVKYIKRLVGAARKYTGATGVSLPLEPRELLNAFDTLSQDASVLILLRKGEQSEYAAMNDEQKSAAAREAVREALGVDTIDGFKKRLLSVALAIHMARYQQLPRFGT